MQQQRVLAAKRCGNKRTTYTWMRACEQSSRVIVQRVGEKMAQANEANEPSCSEQQRLVRAGELEANRYARSNRHARM